MIDSSKMNLLAVVTCCCLLLIGGSAHAGTLAGNAFAYNDGNGPAAGAWTGTSPFTNDGLTGTVDWAVFTAAVFNVQFGGAGYTPPAGEFVYAHQVFTTGTTIGASGLSIALAGGPAGNAGSFDNGTTVTGVNVLSANADPSLADFALVAETSAATPSDGLVYASANPPQLTGSPFVVDGGLSAFGTLPIGIPIVPEPASWLIASVAAAFVVAGRRKRNC